MLYQPKRQLIAEGIYLAPCEHGGYMPCTLKTKWYVTKILQLTSALGILASCAPSSSFDQAAGTVGNEIVGQQPSDNSSSGGTDTETPRDTTNTPPANNSDSINFDGMEKLGWEVKVPARKSWSIYVYSTVANEEPQMLADNPAQDVGEFCPRYNTLTRDQRLNFWGQLISAMAYYESAWNPLSRFWEKSMGVDPITGGNVYSEGLLQLSYQDIRPYKFCEFDWSKDKSLAANDPKKTILDPAKNLRCGVKILAKQLTREKMIGSTKGVYWAVLMRNSTRHKIPQIAALTKSLSFCK